MGDLSADNSTYEVLAVRYGTRPTDREESYLNFHLYGEPNAEMTMDYFFWLARNEQRTVLIDCGFSPQVGARRGRTTVCPPLDALAKVGYAPSDLDLLILTHAHYDHIGNLHRFPDTGLIASQRELEFWGGPLARHPQFASATEPTEIATLRKAVGDDRVVPFSGECTPAPGVTVVEVGGHTPGQIITLVDTPNGQVVLSSDAVHFYEEYEREWPFSYVANLEEMYRAFALIREITSDPGRVLVAGHDPEVFQRFPAVSPELSGLAVRVS